MPQLEKLSDGTGYAVSGGLLTYGWVGQHLNEIAVFFGMLMGLLTFLSSLYFKIKRDHRERDARRADDLLKQQEAERRREMHEAKLSAINQNSRFLTEHSEDS